MDSPWDEHPGSTNTIQELEWTRLSSEFTKTGYREGITAGKESALQEGFDQGFAMAGVPIGRELGLMRGTVSAILSFLNETSSAVIVHPEIDDQIITETQEINSRLSKIRFSDMMPPDLEAEEHARRHREEDGDELDEGQERSRTREMDLLEDVFEQMNTDSERTNGLHPPRGRPTAQDVEVLKNRLDLLVARLGMNVGNTI